MSLRTPDLAGLIDVSPSLSTGTPVWPGDQPLSIRWTQRLIDGDSTNLSAITLTPHLGAHADAPLHLFDGGRDMEAFGLKPFIGPAMVVDVFRWGPQITARHLDELDLAGVERLLLRTRSPRASEGVPPDPAHLTADAADVIAGAGLLLVGIDTPSVDAAAALGLPVHRRLLAAGIAILEGLDLALAPPGRYELLALPLRLAGVEASPVRAVLRPLPQPPLQPPRSG
jgi:arylformamidase